MFKTDNDGLFEYSLETVSASELDLTFHTLDLHASERAETNIMTEYERNFSEKGVKIKMLEAVKEVAPVMFADAGPGCVRGACPEGSKCCGNPRSIAR